MRWKDNHERGRTWEKDSGPSRDLEKAQKDESPGEQGPRSSCKQWGSTEWDGLAGRQNRWSAGGRPRGFLKKRKDGHSDRKVWKPTDQEKSSEGLKPMSVGTETASQGVLG